MKAFLITFLSLIFALGCDEAGVHVTPLEKDAALDSGEDTLDATVSAESSSPQEDPQEDSTPVINLPRAAQFVDITDDVRIEVVIGNINLPEFEKPPPTEEPESDVGVASDLYIGPCQVSSTNIGGSLAELRHYDGDLVVETSFHFLHRLDITVMRIEHFYDEDGQLIQEFEYSNRPFEEPTRHRIREYNLLGEMVLLQEDSDVDGEFDFESEYTYRDGRRRRAVHRHVNGEDLLEVRYHYNGNGQVNHVIGYNPDGSLSYELRMQYNALGLLEMSGKDGGHYAPPDGVYEFITRYEYDEFGNLTHQNTRVGLDERASALSYSDYDYSCWFD